MLILLPLLGLVGALFFAVSWIEDGAVSRVEARNIAMAAEVQRDAVATKERLHDETKAELATVSIARETEIAAIRAAETRARAEADAHAATAERAFAMVDELEGRTCPAPEPGDPCPFLCTPPELPE